MKKLLLIFASIAIQSNIQAFSFGDAFDAVKNAVEGAAGQTGTSDQANQNAIAQLQSVVNQYQAAFQQEQAALQQEGAVIAQEQNTMTQCQVEKAMYLYLLPHAPPATDPADYKKLVIGALINLFNPSDPDDKKTAMHNAFSPDDLIQFAQTLIPLVDADIQQLQNQWQISQGPLWIN